ncbi:MAG TPA: SDR family oxidoreductase [Steroidobacteraceae bacterium]|nr:SDR family oxidoreductase [Steroidobacteraceae bacterium]
MNFSGKTVLLTGASSGIGLSCTQQLLEANASVILVDRQPAPLAVSDLHGGPPRILSVTGDVADARIMSEAIERGCERFGRLDAAINCAGLKGLLVPLTEQSDEALDELYAVNVRGVFLAMKYELRRMIPQGRGAIVNVSSIYGLRSAQKFALYSATKHAVVGLTQGAALEVAACGIRINAVAPGPVNTPFLGRQLTERERVSPVTPLSRFAEPAEIAQAILWLCSDAASFVTGQVLSVDGGMSAQSLTRLESPQLRS